MTEILTESFCERCGTRYTFESAAPASRRLGGLKVLGRGLKQFVMSDSTSLDEAIASARSEVERDATNQQLDAFHRTFSFCLGCRQYTCANCWNEGEARCQSCAPLAIVQDDPYVFEGLPAGAVGLIGLESAAPHDHGPAVEVPSTFAEAWAARPPIEFQAPAAPVAPESAHEAPWPAAIPDPAVVEGIWIGVPEADALAEIADAGAPAAASAGVEALETTPLPVAPADDEVDAESVEAWAHRPQVAYFADGSASRDEEPGADPDGGDAAELDQADPDGGGDHAMHSVADEHIAAAAPVADELVADELVADEPVADEPVSSPTGTSLPQVDTIPQPVWPNAAMPRPAVPTPDADTPAGPPEAATPDAPTPLAEPVGPITAFPPIATSAVPPVVPPVMPTQPVAPVASAPWPASDVVTPPSPRPTSPGGITPEPRPAAPPQWPTGPRWPTGVRPADAGSPEVDALAALMARKTTDAMWAASNRQILQPLAEAATVAAVKACGNCGTSLSANARFCRRCGTSQA